MPTPLTHPPPSARGTMISHRQFHRPGPGSATETAAGRVPAGDVTSGPFLIDGHVHFYPAFDRDLFFDNALANFRSAAGPLRTNAEYAGWLLFAESASMNYFQRFRDGAGRTAGDGWTFHGTDEAGSLVAQRGADAKLLLVAGRQIITTEGLEVLALCCDKEIDDGQPLPAVVRAASRLDAIVVLPWAFGKWWFRRGDLISEFIESARPVSIFLGDNGGRPRFGPRPRPFRLAESRGIRILPGSDPFPLSSDVKRIGSYGFAIDGMVERSRPAAGLKRLLRNGFGQPLPYGNLIGVIGFCRNQLLIRINAQRIHVRRAAEER